MAVEVPPLSRMPPNERLGLPPSAGALVIQAAHRWDGHNEFLRNRSQGSDGPTPKAKKAARKRKRKPMMYALLAVIVVMGLFYGLWSAGW